jgi:hypothetical protein
MPGLRRAAGTAASTAAAVPVVPQRTVKPLLVPRAAESDEGPEEITRDTIKRLTKLFYYDKAGKAGRVQDSSSHADTAKHR